MTRFKNGKSSLLLNLALLAFLVRGMIPAGFMPGHSANSLYPMVICSGSGSVIIHVTADKLPYNPAPSQPHSHDNMPCPFAMAFAQGVLGGPVELGYIPMLSASVPVYPQAHAQSNPIVKGYFSHGPPIFLS